MRKNSPAIIFIDEIDSIAPKRDKTSGEVVACHRVRGERGWHRNTWGDDLWVLAPKYLLENTDATFDMVCRLMFNV